LDLVEDGSFPLQHYYQKMLWILDTVYAQQNEKYQSKVNSIPSRIVSAQQPYVRPIVRGKANHNVEFGSKINISEVDGLSRADFIRWEAYNEAGDLPAMVENYREMYGYYPEYVVVDKIYMNRSNRKWMKERGIKTVGPALGRPKKIPKTEEELAFEKALLRSRNHVEGKIGQGKNKYGLKQIRGKSMDSSEGNDPHNLLLHEFGAIAQGFLGSNSNCEK
jgi:transposase, IS5 family